MIKTSREDFEALIRRSGLPLSAAQMGHVHEGWGYIEPMLERIRSPERDRSAEPAAIFRAAAFGRAPKQP